MPGAAVDFSEEKVDDNTDVIGDSVMDVGCGEDTAAVDENVAGTVVSGAVVDCGWDPSSACVVVSFMVTWWVG